jgi:fatty-acyl-CoA synthase
MRSPLKAWVRALELTAPIDRNRTGTLPFLVGSLAERFGSTPALASPAARLTYTELAESVNRYARWGLAQGLAPGDVVSLLMPNCPDYMAIWLGLTRIGVTVSLLNTQLTGPLLAHSIQIVTPRYVIVAAASIETALAARLRLPDAVDFWAYGAGDHALPRLDLAAAQLSSESLSHIESPPPSLDDRALYIYTSGTTGLPKAANVSHFRIMQWSHWFAGLMNTRPGDRMYNCLPLYHSIGGVVATGATLVGGGTVVLRERFSAREFWPDVVRERCTLFQYIGELCRYLVNSPEQPEETRHQLRLCCGNGLRADVWDAFKARFRIPQILEYYAATEGNFSLYNYEGRRGSIGRIPPFLSHRMPVALVKFDVTTGAPARDQAGLCIRCGPNETGEAVGEIHNGSGVNSSRFEGYADPEASRQKVLRNVFAAGDAWYRTGDLMRQDDQGFYYFVDRVGDTYRWKGENVSTTEVGTAIMACPGVAEAAVYGVAIPGTEGRAGMVTVVAAPQLDLGEFRRHVSNVLPDYARPLFVRLVASIELTGTFKLNKQALVLEGYDPGKVPEGLYFDDRKQQAYVKLDASLYERIVGGQLRL